MFSKTECVFVLLKGSCSLFANLDAGNSLLVGQSVVQNLWEGKGGFFSSGCILCVFKCKDKV